MDAAHRRMEILHTLCYRKFATARELSEEFQVSIRTIQNDILELSLDYPIYTKQGGSGGIFMSEHYKSYINTLTQEELHILCEMYAESVGRRKEILCRIIRKYGSDKLEL